MGFQTAIQSHGQVESGPTETYGTGRIVLRIGNGGAGATGLIKALAHDYLSTRSDHASIQWICNHSRNTQLALLQGYIDLALTYERDQEEISVSEGWAVSAGCVFRDHFCIVGPVHDPAGIRSHSTIIEALTAIKDTKSLFHSRADSSATMFKERQLWTAAGLLPWTDGAASEWYRTSLLGPAEALVKADQAGAYLLTDRSTLLRQVELGGVLDCTCFFEPVKDDDVLMNNCYALYSPPAESTTQEEINVFIEYLHSPRGQNVVAAYGTATVGIPFFAPVRDGFASTTIVGGRPRHKRWVQR